MSDGLLPGGRDRDYVMAWVSVPELTVEDSMQRYEPLAPGRIRFRAGAFAAHVDSDSDGIVRRYGGLAERIV